MSIIPTPETMEQLAHVARTELPPVPKVRIFACGGCGTNLVSRVEGGLASLADVKYFDTSLANRLGNNIDPDRFTVLAGGYGSGGERIANFEKIRQALTDLSDDEIGFADINIAVVTFSAAGGSGSVIGPLLVNDLQRRAKLRRQEIRVIAVVVGDSQSLTSANNTKRTLQTLRSLAEDSESGFYLPTMVFTNKVGRNRVDTTLKYRLNALIEVLTLPVLEVDFADRMNAIGPARLINSASGVRLMHVAYGVESELTSADGAKQFNLEDVKDSGEVFVYPKTGRVDTLLSLALKTETGFTPVTTTLQGRARFDGQFATTQSRPMLMMVTSDDQPLTSLIVEIEDTVAAFASTESSAPSAIDNSGGIRKGAFVF